MGKKERKYIFALLLITVVVVTIRLLQPEPVDWSEGYSNLEKKPFGGFILYQELPTLFPDREIFVNKQPVFEQMKMEKKHNQIFINSSFEPDEFETEILLDEVDRGSDLFISAYELGGALADSLNIVLAASFPSINPTISNLDSLFQNKVSLTNRNLNSSESWNFPVGLTEAYFISFDTLRTTVLGKIGENRVNFVQIDHGKGSIFLHSNPFLFSNYYLKDASRFDYAFAALSYLQVRDTIWDEYYKVSRVSFASSLSYVVSQPNLKWAWFICVAGLIGYLIFGSKRKQRVIPEIKPVSNTSLVFTSTVANLYLNNGTHKDILDKKILFLKDYIRTNLNINPDETDDIHTKIAQRSGIEKEKIQDIFAGIKTVLDEKEISSKRLKQITDQIDWFYKHSHR